jgi:transcriptional regulator with XRE-family HTH domain
MTLGEKLRLIRTSEHLTQVQMATAVDVSLDTYKNFELARRKKISALELLKITNHAHFTQYTLWLMTGQTIPEAGQICPV